VILGIVSSASGPVVISHALVQQASGHLAGECGDEFLVEVVSGSVFSPLCVPLHNNLGEYYRDNSGEAGKGYRDNLGAS
jgi:hypothetical protein